MNGKITLNDAKLIRLGSAKGMSHKQMADNYGVKINVIDNIVNGLTFKE